MPDKIALVTGASSGFGKLIAETLTRHGFTVYGTSRRDSPDTSAGVKMRVLDVTDDASVAACVQGVIDEVGRIDLLVNNAGIVHDSFIEETPPEVVEAVIQTNFYGTVRVTRAVLPHMRAQRAGQVINLTSLAGLVSPPMQAYYAASKHAVEGFTEALHYEIESFGIKVSLVEPGFFKTDIHGNTDHSQRNPIPDYDELRQRTAGVVEKNIAEGGDPQQVADVIARVASDPNPRLRYPVGTDAVWTPRFKRLSQRLFGWGLRRKFNLD